MNGTKNTKAVLLENHGVLAFGANPAAAARANLIVEEAAQMAIYAEVLGGAKMIPPELLKATVGRRDEFARAGMQRHDIGRPAGRPNPNQQTITSGTRKEERKWL